MRRINPPIVLPPFQPLRARAPSAATSVDRVADCLRNLSRFRPTASRLLGLQSSRDMYLGQVFGSVEPVLWRLTGGPEQVGG